MNDTVYPRDASWWDRPGTGRVYHRPDDPERPVWAACAVGRIALYVEGGARATDMPNLLCRRAACRQSEASGRMGT